MEHQAARLQDSGKRMESSSGQVKSSDNRRNSAIDTSTKQLGFPQFQLASPSLESPHESPLERPSVTSLRSSYRTNVSSPGIGTIRAVTPDLGDRPGTNTSTLDPNLSHISRNINSQQSSPRSIPGVDRRQGMVFNDSFGESYESTEASPPSSQTRGSNGNFRPRTRTMETSMLNQRSAPPGHDNRHRVGSVSSSGSQVDEPRANTSTLDTVLSSMMADAAAVSATASATAHKAKKTASRRLVKRVASRPTSPGPAIPPSLDAFPFPLAAADPNKIILLMKTLCGKMRGEVEYQGETGPWHTGVAYIDEEKGNLMFDTSMSGAFHIPLMFDLRGCRVMPVECMEEEKLCLELVSSLQPDLEIVLRPLVAEDFDLWLAALLCWQQMRPPPIRLADGKSSIVLTPIRPELKRQGKSVEGIKHAAIIKVGNVMLWDKGPATSARGVMKRSSTRDIRSPQMSWRRVSCILHDNGDFRLLVESDSAALSVIELSQLSRGAIQPLSHGVLDEEYCIAIFPLYASNASRISVFRPVYLSMESRIHFEVWFVLLRAFAVPDIYKLDDSDDEQVHEVEDLEKDKEKEKDADKELSGEMFRVEKSISVRVIEAKLRAPTPGTDPSTLERVSKAEADGLVGNYLAEVILDGTVRARTTTKPNTKNPFWREDCEFVDLPPTTPSLSVELKHVIGPLDTPSNHHLQHQQSSQLKPPNLQEMVCGSVELGLDTLERGKDHEQWLQIMDDKQRSIGSMLIKVSHDQHVVLLQKEYKELSDKLHNFPNGLTTLVSGVLPGQLRRLAKTFLNIFQVTDTASEWLMALVEDEIDGIGNQTSIKYRFGSRLRSNDSIESTTDRELMVRDMSKNLAGEANLLFRGNSLLTASLETHMRRLGKEFLEESLQAKIFEINELNPDCEVDPARLQHNGGDLDQHWSQLIHITTEIWQCILTTVNKIPSELRQLLKYIRAVAEDRYGDFLRSVTCTAVSGFLFLRFICPAILSPKLFGLLRDHPQTRAQRTFTLVAKALQKMANLSTFGKREEYMEPMNRFLTTQRQKFKDYIDQVCAVSAERLPYTVPPNYSTPVTIMSRLSPAAQEGFPSLPYLLDHARSFASLVKIWTSSNPLTSKEDPDAELVAFDKLCRALDQRADACLVKAERHRINESTANADELCEALEQATLIESMNYTPKNPTSSSGNGAIPVITPAMTPSSSGSDAADDAKGSGSEARSLHRKRSREIKKATGLRQVSNATSGPSTKVRNVRVGKTILNGIMRIGGRAESPDGKNNR